MLLNIYLYIQVLADLQTKLNLPSTFNHLKNLSLHVWFEKFVKQICCNFILWKGSWFKWTWNKSDKIFY